MSKIAFILACLSYSIPGRRVRASPEQSQDMELSQSRASLNLPAATPSLHAYVERQLSFKDARNPLRAFALLLLKLDQVNAFNHFAQGLHGVAGSSRPRSKVPSMVTAAELRFEGRLVNAKKTVLVGRKAALLGNGIASMLPEGCPPELFRELVESVGDAGDDGKKESSLFRTLAGTPATIVAAVLPEACSRYASPIRQHAVTALVGAAIGSETDAQVIAVLEEPAHAGGTACAIARAFPLFNFRKTVTNEDEIPLVRVGFGDATRGLLTNVPYEAYASAAAAVRRAARLVDMPPDVLTTTEFVEEAIDTAERLEAKGRGPIEIEVTKGIELKQKGYGLLYGVGKAAEEPPALVVMSVRGPPATAGRGDSGGSTKTICLVGKGIVYDTGGLALKSKEGMPGMKADCGGAAAMLAAFEAAVEIGLQPGTALHLVLCLAENAIGPAAIRLDDVLVGVSGLTCEINNSDAEGRLILADGVAHCTALPPRLPWLEGQPDLIIDAATLTGAQMIATGKRHAAVIANTEEVELAAVAAGRRSGDLVHPLPFAPEFYRKEFKSKVANMKNSVKDRSNAQTSCAANFIYEHLHPDYRGGWLHVDLAGPAFIDERGTGFGVGLTLAMLEVDGFNFFEALS